MMIGILIGIGLAFTMYAIVSVPKDPYMEAYELQEQSDYLKKWEEEHRK